MKTNWDKQWASGSARSYWNTPDKHVAKFSDDYSIGKGDVALDLGCGIGRHSIYLSKRGARVTAIDESAIAVSRLAESAAALRLEIDMETCDYLSFRPREKFDYVIAFNVIYHGDAAHFSKSIAKCYELLKPEGALFFTCPSRSDGKYGSGNEVAENTYESLNSLHSGDMHYFACESELKELLCQFAAVKIETDEYYWDNNGVAQFASNYIVVADKVGSRVAG